MIGNDPTICTDVEECVDRVIDMVGRKIVLGLPLGLGKPCQFVNALYRRAVEDPGLHLRIVTALSIERPTPGSDLERRFLEPFLDRVFGNYPALEYVSAVRSRALPANVEMTEFFLSPGKYLNNPIEQQNYISSNYTHVARDIVGLGANVCAHLVSKAQQEDGTFYSLSSNPDLTLDLVALMRDRARRGGRAAVVGQVNNNLPFMFHDAVAPPGTFDLILDNPAYDFQLFGPPNMAIGTADYMIGQLTSALIKDGGTLQIGIGSLGDAIVYSALLRHRENETYRAALSDLGIVERFGGIIDDVGGTAPFSLGLYGSSEMFVSGFMELYKAGVLTREVYPDETIQRLANEGRIAPEVTAETLRVLLEEGAIQPRLTAEDFDLLQRLGVLRDALRHENGTILAPGGRRIGADLSVAANFDQIARHGLGSRLDGGVVMHGGFFMGPQNFYEWLRQMDEAERKKFCMTSVMFVNHLYGNQELATLQRKDARFLNTTMMVTLSGAACSDGLENGQVVSGVGGQYNFVAMAHELPGARSILMLRSTRAQGEKVTSNIVQSYGHLTIPRHLRDIVITEYGIADLRGKTDKEIIAALLNITDSRFQEDLLGKAKRAGKLPLGYRIPSEFQDNTPERLEAQIKQYRANGYFPTFPFGTDFTDEEIVLGKALKALKAKLGSPGAAMMAIARAVEVGAAPEAATPYLERMQLDRPETIKERMAQKMIVSELVAQGVV